MSLADSGARTTYESGAQREVTENKGRCDLLPLDVLAKYYSNYDSEHELQPDYILLSLHNFLYTGDLEFIYAVLWYFVGKAYDHDSTKTFLEVSKHYRDGAIKYADRNWEKGLPVHSFIDSGVRHYLKYIRHDTDEPHDRAFVWNILGCIWTIYHHPELNDLPYTMKGTTHATESKQSTDCGRQPNWTDLATRR
jgi:hypothetical protein